MTLPTTFTADQQAAALTALGLDQRAHNIASVLLEPHAMTIVEHTPGATGMPRLRSDRTICTTTTFIPMATTEPEECL